jgi:uncharacterized membrane protein
MKITEKNKIILIVGIILIFIGLVLIITSKEAYFEKVELSSNNLVANRSELAYVDSIVKVGLDSLEIKGVAIIVRPMSKELLNSFKDKEELDLAASIRGKNGQYILYVKKTNRREAIEVVAHELIHLQQYQSRDLVLYKDYVIYKKDTFKGSEPYQNRLWEVEAFKEGPKLARKIVEELY